jgi:hypothetical protein
LWRFVARAWENREVAKEAKGSAKKREGEDHRRGAEHAEKKGESAV